MANNYQVAAYGGFGQVVLAAAETSAAGQEFVAVFATEESVISYDSAAYTNHGDASISSITIPAGATYVAHMTNIEVVSGNVIAHCLTAAD